VIEASTISTRFTSLFDRTLSCLVVIDVQAYFLGKLPLDWREPLVARIAWLMQVARHLDIPIIATAEDIAKSGPLVPELERELPSATPVHDKMMFGLCGQPSILEAITATGRKHAVLVGLETDVCVAQSAIGLAERGFSVAVLEDATASPPPHHQAGLARIASAGVTITTMKGLYYEWVRGVALDAETKRKLNSPLPPGLTL
jgi:nicotinamidase-related amidase